MKKDRFLLLPILILFLITGAVVGYSDPALTGETDGKREGVEEEITLVMTGDLYLGSWLEPILLKNPAYPYADPGVRELLEEADLVLGNLECPISRRGEVYVEKKYTF